MDEVIQVRAVAKRNGFTTSLLGLVGLLFSAGLLAVLPEGFFLPGIFLVSASLVTILVGWFKVREPVFSMEISRQNLLYHHRRGQWQLDWQNVQRVDQPRIHAGLEQQSLQMVGIRIKDYEPLLAVISPRLITHMLMEQRPLLLQSHSAECASGTCYSENLIESDRYQSPTGKAYKGVQAMFANRMQKLRERLGYDLFISESELDRSAADFVQLLRDCQQRLALDDRTGDAPKTVDHK